MLFHTQISQFWRAAPTTNRLGEVVAAVRGSGRGRRHQVHAAVHVDEVHEVGEVVQVAADVEVGARLHCSVTDGPRQQETPGQGSKKTT